MIASGLFVGFVGTALAAWVLAVATAVAALSALAATAWAAGRWRERARLRHAAPARPLLIEVAAAEGRLATQALAQLTALDPARWRAIEPTAAALLAKVRGTARASLTTLFEERGTTGRALRDLRARRWTRREQAARVLGHLCHDAAAPELCRLLDDRSPAVRVAAARALGRLMSPCAAAPLLRKLTDRRPVPPDTVAHALVRIGPAGESALVTATTAVTPLTRVVAVEVLGCLDAVTAAPALVARLEEDPCEEVRLRAAVALGRLGLPETLPSLVGALNREASTAVRAAAATALGELRSAAAVEPLRELLDDPDHRVARHAAYGLVLLGAEHVLARVASGPLTAAAAHARHTLAVAALGRRCRPPQPAPRHEGAFQ